MNCPSRVDPVVPDGYNQNPDALNADATTNSDMSHIANARLREDHRLDPSDGPASNMEQIETHIEEDGGSPVKRRARDTTSKAQFAVGEENANASQEVGEVERHAGNGNQRQTPQWAAPFYSAARRSLSVLRKYAKFVGPGFMVAVAYIDPGSFPTLRGPARRPIHY